MKSVCVVIVLLMLVGSGCRTPPVAPVPDTADAAPPVLMTVGHVLRVNAARGYVVVECGSLPSPGEEARVFRGEQAVARLKLSGPRRPPFVTGDIVEGQPETGDTVKVFRKRAASARSEVQKP
jgi:hypothetical protein